MKGGLRQQRKAEIPQRKMDSKEQKSSVVYGSILKGKLEKGQ